MSSSIVFYLFGVRCPRCRGSACPSQGLAVDTMSYTFSNQPRPRTGRQRVSDNRNNRPDTALWGVPASNGGMKPGTQQRQFKSTSLWSVDEPKQQIQAPTSSRSTPRTSLWGTIDTAREQPTKQPPHVKPAPFATSATPPSTQPPPQVRQAQPFATEADIVSTKGAEELRSALTYDIEERYRQAADAFVAADMDRSGFLEQDEVCVVCIS